MGRNEHIALLYSTVPLMPPLSARTFIIRDGNRASASADLQIRTEICVFECFDPILHP